MKPPLRVNDHMLDAGSSGANMKAKLLARAFDIITCQQGHPCYMTTRSLRQCDIMSADAFMAIGSALPLEPMTPVTHYPCPTCGNLVFRGGQFYVRGQLRGHEGVYLDEGLVDETE